MPRVSIIMACFNAEQFVAEAVRSVLGQTFEDFELIVVDDCSSDKSVEVVKSTSAGDQRVKILTTASNSGASAARNLAFLHASGEWFAILDADDVFLPNKLAKQIARIDNTKGFITLIGAGCHIVNRQGEVQSTHRYPERSNTLKRRLIGHVPFPPHSSLMYRASAIQELKGFNSRFDPAEDLDLWLRLRPYGEFACLPEPLVKYRVHENNTSSGVSKRGYTHLDYVTAASVCALLRDANQPDPSTGAEEQSWREFMAFISLKVQQTRMIEFRLWKKTWRNGHFANQIRPIQFLIFLRETLSHPLNMWRLVREHIDGNRLASTCFKSWVDKTSS